jgi:hypothetical protein
MKMRRYRIVQALLLAGVILGYGGGIARLVHHHRGHCDRDRGRDRDRAAERVRATDRAPEPPPARAEPAPAE